VGACIQLAAVAAAQIMRRCNAPEVALEVFHLHFEILDEQTGLFHDYHQHKGVRQGRQPLSAAAAQAKAV
jgi:hypothetical protein